MSASVSERLCELNKTIEAEAAAAFAAADRIALMGFPLHDNIGDSIIFQGTIQVLHRLGKEVSPIIDSYGMIFDAAAIRNRVSCGSVAIGGGGWFGDLWPRGHYARLRLIDSLADYPIVQLPQSIHFENAEALEETQRVIARHQRFTLMTRDQASFDFARSKFECDVRLVPDFGLAAKISQVSVPKRHPGKVIVCRRQDREAEPQTSASTDPSSVFPGFRISVLDDAKWTSQAGTALKATIQFLTTQLRLRPRALDPLRSLYNVMCIALVNRRVSEGIGLLEDAEVVIADRLHIAIAALLSGRFVIAVDNRVGKLSALFSTWLGDVDGLVLVDGWNSLEANRPLIQEKYGLWVVRVASTETK